MTDFEIPLVDVVRRLERENKSLREQLAWTEKRVPRHELVLDALGDVVCQRCSLATRDSGPGCPACWDRRDAYAKARLP